ncbi:MBL fold metallo-hydrolase [Oceanimonas marisflavi]|uniref:MBL fold metallo-hydrolase n=1 Tax=Oceanimonas marisflavi TaxID=2059724 RepID=UPI000D302DA9|nr:MBL fold metallo-hydrolase [Oceanimonas marisflavi]
MHPLVTPFFDDATSTFSYVVRDPASASCAIIDAVLDFEYAGGTISTRSADALLAHIAQHRLQPEWILETHVHADHLSAAAYLRRQTGARLGIGAQITAVQNIFGERFNAGPDFATDGSQFDALFEDGDTITIGTLTGRAMHTPGHTPACLTYVFGDAAFVGDTLFMPDYGSARCDFPGGDAASLYRSVQRIFALPNDTRLFMCHDYKGPDRDHYQHQSSVEEQRRHNVHLRQGITQDEFVRLRRERDSTLPAPRLLLPSIQVNMRAGELPPAENNDQVYLKVPVNRF